MNFPVETFSSNGWHEACGVFGIWKHDAAVDITRFALHMLQHRGQESAGIAAVDRSRMSHYKGMGLVSEVLTAESMAMLRGDSAIGHVRYSTTGASELCNAQPFVFNFHGRSCALAHNGNLTNARDIRESLAQQGSTFQSTSDSELVAHLMLRTGEASFIDSLVASMPFIEGAYAFVLLTANHLIALRDPLGLRPLVLGKLGDAIVVASESCAFDALGASYVRDVEPGEMVIITSEGMSSRKFAPPLPKAICTFEYIYFARPDSTIDGINVHLARKHMGRALAHSSPVVADLVTGVPDSGSTVAIGYAEEAGIAYDAVLIKNKYVGRTFIQPDQQQRVKSVCHKLNVVRQAVEGKRIIVVDDSLVRGTTCAHVVKMLHAAGAKEVHVRIGAPPVVHPCFYGIDIDDKFQLMAAQKSPTEIASFLGADSLAYLSEEEMLHALGVTDTRRHPFCNACFTGRYPTRLHRGMWKHTLERLPAPAPEAALS